MQITLTNTEIKTAITQYLKANAAVDVHDISFVRKMVGEDTGINAAVEVTVKTPEEITVEPKVIEPMVQEEAPEEYTEQSEPEIHEPEQEEVFEPVEIEVTEEIKVPTKIPASGFVKAEDLRDSLDANDYVEKEEAPEPVKESEAPKSIADILGGL